jgi:type VI secretion system protein ImpA
MIMNPINTSDSYVHELFNVPLSCISSPVSSDNPCGDDLSNSDLFFEIEQARSFDDPSIPAGVWSHELKKADWNHVIGLTTTTLTNTSKDLRLAIWLFEAATHVHGFAALAPCFRILRELCDTFWNQMYPVIDDNDIEQRINLFLWIDNKLSVELRLLPITRMDETGIVYSQNDYDLAKRYETVKTSKNEKKVESDTISIQNFNAAVLSTSDKFYESLLHDIITSSEELNAFIASLQKFCGNDTPGFEKTSRFLENITIIIKNILDTRGRFETVENSPVTAGTDDAGNEYENQENNFSGRERAYTLLAEAADYLMYTDPHSPVPYLIHKAIKWGEMNTAELYSELFVAHDGKLDIFELLGIERNKK